MGSRGPIPKRAARSVRTAEGVRLRPLPDEQAAIFKRLAKDVAGLTPADVALVEDTARWVTIAKEAYAQLADVPQTADEVIERMLILMTTDTAHGNKSESRKSPLLIVLRTASEQIRANAQQLGATPMARARLPAPTTEQMSLADILFADVGADHE